MDYILLYGFLIDSLTDEQFGSLAEPYKQELSRLAISEQEQLEQETKRVEEKRLPEKFNEPMRKNQLAVIKHMRQTNQVWPMCPKCGSKTAVRLGKTFFWGCTNYPECRGTKNVPESFSTERPRRI